MAKHDLSTHVFKVRITNTAPSATMDKIACITTIATGGGWATDVALTISNATLVGSTYTLTFADVTIEANATGTIANWRYPVVYNSNDATGHLVGWLDYGTVIDISTGEKVVIDFDSTLGSIIVV
jgi:hypothetical protein